MSAADIEKKLEAFVGPQGVADFKTLIQSEAKIGALAASPEIEYRVRTEVLKSMRPFVIGSIAIGGIAITLGIIGIASQQRVPRRRSLSRR